MVEYNKNQLDFFDEPLPQDNMNYQNTGVRRDCLMDCLDRNGIVNKRCFHDCRKLSAVENNFSTNSMELSLMADKIDNYNSMSF